MKDFWTGLSMLRFGLVMPSLSNLWAKKKGAELFCKEEKICLKKKTLKK